MRVAYRKAAVDGADFVVGVGIRALGGHGLAIVDNGDPPSCVPAPPDADALRLRTTVRPDTPCISSLALTRW